MKKRRKIGEIEDEKDKEGEEEEEEEEEVEVEEENEEDNYDHDDVHEGEIIEYLNLLVSKAMYRVEVPRSTELEMQTSKRKRGAIMAPKSAPPRYYRDKQLELYGECLC